MKHGNEVRMTRCEWGQVIKEGLFEEQTQTETKGEKAVSRWKFGKELFRLRKSPKVSETEMSFMCLRYRKYVHLELNEQGREMRQGL